MKFRFHVKVSGNVIPLSLSFSSFLSLYMSLIMFLLSLFPVSLPIFFSFSTITKPLRVGQGKERFFFLFWITSEPNLGYVCITESFQETFLI